MDNCNTCIRERELTALALRIEGVENRMREKDEELTKEINALKSKEDLRNYQFNEIMETLEEIKNKPTKNWNFVFAMISSITAILMVLLTIYSK